MPYSEKEMEEIECDPVRLKGYFWKVAMKALARSRKNMAAFHKKAKDSSPVNYNAFAKDSYKEFHWAQVEESFAKAILDNLDNLVESTVKKSENR